jgi:quinol monooxygenase YgiN
MSNVDVHDRQNELEVMLVISIQTRPGMRHEQIAAFEKLAPVVRSEPGCIQYDLHTVFDDNDRFILIERWASAEALAAHDVTPHMIAADAHSPSFRAAPARVVCLSANSIA